LTGAASLFSRGVKSLQRPGKLAFLLARRKEASVTVAMKPRVTSLAPQFLVNDLERSMAYYRRLGFTFGEPWDNFYAIGLVDGMELHLKEAPKNEAERRHRRDNEHLDAAAGVDGIEAFYGQCVANGITILKPLTATAWGTKDFYIEDPDGYVICFGGRPAADKQEE
jgi:catechol 2,3-dioxygenase-like lactoylglutathione lyase family enzyme